jgi:hypothetical protein
MKDSQPTAVRGVNLGGWSAVLFPHGLPLLGFKDDERCAEVIADYCLWRKQNGFPFQVVQGD